MLCAMMLLGADQAIDRRGARAISEIRRDANRSWSKGKWRKAKVDPKVKIPNDVLLTLLSRKHSANTSIDAYIKWRLMSLGADLTTASPEQIDRIAQMIPALIQQPQGKTPRSRTSGGGAGGGVGRHFSTGRQRAIVTGQKVVSGAKGVAPKLGVVSEGSSLGTRGAVQGGSGRSVITEVQTANARLKRSQRRVDFENEPILNLRDIMIEALPAAGGVRFTQVLNDTAERIATGEPSWQDSVDRLLLESTNPAMNLTDKRRAALVKMVTRLGLLEGEVTDEFIADGSRAKVDKDVIMIRREDLSQLLTNLRGDER